MRPYIGIVGLKNEDEVFRTAGMVHVALGAREKTQKLIHLVQIGVQVTDRTLRGEVTESRRNPKVADIPGMFRTAMSFREDFFTVVHYTSKNHDLIFESVRKILGLEDMYKNGWCHGIQLNGCFGKIKPEVLSGIKDAYPDLKIILQLNGGVLESMNEPEIARELVKFGGLTDYVLIDPSGGRGQKLDVGLSLEVAKEILYITNRVAVAFAGGLRGSNVFGVVNRLRGGLRKKDFSIDAEGGLRDKVGEGYGNDNFNLCKAESYFKEAVRAFR